MEHKGVPYTVRQGIEHDTWTVEVILPTGKTTKRHAIGSRDYANEMARAIIDKWLEKNKGG
jgi:hypothetical protein